MSNVPVLDRICELPGGGYLYREKLDTDGFVFYSDEGGEVIEIWNTDNTSRAALMMAMAADEMRLHSVLKEILES